MIQRRLRVAVSVSLVSVLTERRMMVATVITMTTVGDTMTIMMLGRSYVSDDGQEEDDGSVGTRSIRGDNSRGS